VYRGRADYDFDAMVTQIAPLDSLRQRFGRLDRLGLRGSTVGIVIAAKDEIGSKTVDAIYGDRTKKTWDWLLAKAPAAAKGKIPRLDFGFDVLDKAIASDPEGVLGCMSAAKSAPVLRAADVAFFAMTNPRPHPDPHLPLFLHGDPRVEADVSVVWRADLSERLDAETATEIVSCLPPKPAEALPIPLWEARRWLTGGARGNLGDVEGAADGETDGAMGGRKALRWRGEDDEMTELVEAGDLRPGDLIVVPSTFGGCDKFGWAPGDRRSVEDLADAAAAPYARRPPCGCIRISGLSQTKHGKTFAAC
jgi:CRISPR-associated endonuclease/helicase Cas3